MENSSRVSLTVKTMDDCDFYLQNLDKETSVLTLKQQINNIKGIEEERQRLIYRGRVLEDHYTISHYSITDGNIVHLVARPENFRELRRESETQSESGGGNSTPDNNIATSQATTTTTSTTTANTQNPTVNADMIEPIWQSLLSLHTLFSVSRDTLPSSTTTATTTNDNARLKSNENDEQDSKDEKESPATEESVASFASAVSHREFAESPASSVWNDHIEYYVGQWLDVKDTVAQWLEATVMEVDAEQRRLYIHYNGWPVRWDEWIAFDSPRIAPFRAITRHTSFNGQSCPTPVTTVPNAPRSGPNDYRLLFPEMARVLGTVTPLIQEASGIVQRNVNDGNLHTSYNHNHTGLDNLPFDTFRNEHHRDDAVNAAELNHQDTTMSNDESMRLMEISDQLCPILDRLGRVLTDFAPHLRQGSDAAYQRDYTRRLAEENEREQEPVNATTTTTASGSGNEDDDSGNLPAAAVDGTASTEVPARWAYTDGASNSSAMLDDSLARNVTRSIGTTYSMNSQFETSPSVTNPNIPNNSNSNTTSTSNRDMLSPYQISQRSFRTPITNARPTLGTLGTTLTTLGTSGQMDIHLAILSPRPARNNLNQASSPDVLFNQAFNGLGTLLSNNSVANSNNTNNTNDMGTSATPSLDNFANAFRSDGNGDSTVTDSPSYSSSSRSEDTTLQRLLNETARRERVAARNSRSGVEESGNWRAATRTTTSSTIQQTTTSNNDSMNEDGQASSTGTSSSSSSSSQSSTSGRNSGRNSIISSLARMFNMGGGSRR
jgi:hypothetical protein